MDKLVNSNNGVELLDTIYQNLVDGIPKVSKPIEELAYDYVKRYKDPEIAIDKMVKNQLSKNTVNGFVSSFGGVITMPATLPVNLTSVIYVQMRMIAAIATIRGYDIRNDEVQTFVYSCMVGNAISDTLKQVGVQIGNKVTTNSIKKISGKTLTKINQAVGFRLITKFGTKGAVNLGKLVPVVGAGVGAAFDYTSTRIIAVRAKKVFVGDDVLDLSVFDK